MVATLKGATMFRSSMENDPNSTKILNLNETLPKIEKIIHKNSSIQTIVRNDVSKNKTRRVLLCKVAYQQVPI